MMQSLKKEQIKTLSIFAIGTLIIGMLTAYISFSLFPVTRTYNLPKIYPSLEVFVIVWIILYPAMGLGAGHIWLKRNEFDVRGVLTFYGSLLLTNFMFLPIANVSNGNPAIMTLMDINGVFSSLLLGWIFSRYSQKAFYCVLPLMLWMPVTALFKILLWAANP